MKTSGLENLEKVNMAIGNDRPVYFLYPIGTKFYGNPTGGVIADHPRQGEIKLEGNGSYRYYPENGNCRLQEWVDGDYVRAIPDSKKEMIRE